MDTVTSDTFGDVTLAVGDDDVAEVEIHRPPNNYFDVALIRSLAAAYEAVDADPRARAIVLCAEGKHFCAGADFTGASNAERMEAGRTVSLYQEAVRLFAARTPVVAAVQGAAIGGGLGLACSADFRVACEEARFAANFARLAFHHGFGLTVTLPAITGQQPALDLLYTGRRIGGEEAARLRLADRLVPQASVRSAARELAAEIAASGPLAVQSIRETMRGHLAEAVAKATAREDAEQEKLRNTADFAEGVKAMAERRTPNFTGR
ncbi:MAG: enoyl-CoA hydratase/isomerase family protein [Acidimicrobiaceae bacterium]|nr:enoyl-CoA hydratase/isomerase family protein [Acidimicrobiaceae bacterium]